MPSSGTVFIGEDADREDFSMWSGRWSAHWEPRGTSSPREGPQGVSASEAIAWGRAQADVVLIRPGDSTQHYSAGHRNPGGDDLDDLPVWPEGKELERRRDPHHAYLDRPADSPPIPWRVRYRFSLARTEQSQFAEQYRLSLERDETIKGVENGGTETEGVFLVRASTSTEAREIAMKATKRARKVAWESLSEPPKDAFWVSYFDDPEPIDDSAPPAA